MRNILVTLALLVGITAHAEHAVMVYNLQTNQAVVSQNADTVRPMASLTKLMTAMVTLDRFSLSDKIATGKKSYVTVESLLEELLVQSSNSAAERLARAYPNGRLAFLEAMNNKATAAGLYQTQFNDPSGLVATNTTTARELVKLVSMASAYDTIRNISSKAEIYRHNKNKTVALDNTNKTILQEFHNIRISKTGTTTPAGRCLAMLVDKQGQQYAIIILGEPSKQARDIVARQLLLADNINH